MQTKLTIRLDAALIRRAKAYARRRHKSLSAIVADYFAALEQPADKAIELTPKVKSLIGALGGKRLNESDYRRYLELKHR
jgi:hypothetical protein